MLSTHLWIYCKFVGHTEIIVYTHFWLKVFAKNTSFGQLSAEYLLNHCICILQKISVCCCQGFKLALGSVKGATCIGIHVH